jgi:(p)ppGpp synthase/HD superfamily hydrolase
VTHKAKQHIRKWVREETSKQSEEGRELWLKKLKKHKFHIADDELARYAHSVRVDNLQDFFVAIKEGTLDPDDIIENLVVRSKHPGGETPRIEVAEQKSIFDRFISSAREITSGISVLGSTENFLHQYAKCCNPIPGDEIVGFVTVGEGIKIHRKDCKNVISMRLTESERLVDVSWPSANGPDFIAALHIAGKDRPALLSDITHTISMFENTNIRSVNMDSKGPIFEGQIIVFVRNTDHLKRLLERLKRVDGVLEADRFMG